MSVKESYFDPNKAAVNHNIRKSKEKVFRFICLLATIIGIAFLVILLVGIFKDGYDKLNWDFLNNNNSRFASKAGVKAALFGTLWVISLTALIAVPIGISAAVYLEEFSKKNRLTSLIYTNISNLAGVPSVVYGLLGLALFVRWMMMGRSVIAGACTMSLLILPTVIIATQEALRSVPNSYRYASLGLGATRWQTIRYQVLPAALPGILTGVILSISRGIGETAPLFMIGAAAFITYLPTSISDGFTVLPIQIYTWSSMPQKAFHETAAGAIVVLLAVLLIMNSTAIIIRNLKQKRRA